MSEMTISVDRSDPSGEERAMAWIRKPGVSSNPRRVNSLAHADEMAREFGIDPRTINFAANDAPWFKANREGYGA